MRMVSRRYSFAGLVSIKSWKPAESPLLGSWEMIAKLLSCPLIVWVRSYDNLFILTSINCSKQSARNAREGMFPWLQQTFVGEVDCGDEPKECLHRRLPPPLWQNDYHTYCRLKLVVCCNLQCLYLKSVVIVTVLLRLRIHWHPFELLWWREALWF